jgi:hypothetical protein
VERARPGRRRRQWRDGRGELGERRHDPVDAAVSINFTAGGGISGALGTALNTATSTLLAAYGGSMKLWHRKNAKGAGQQMTILSGVMATRQVVLRSRRD